MAVDEQRVGRVLREHPPGEDLLRELMPRVLGALVRRYGDVARCEDAVRKALISAVSTWRHAGVPANPLGWLSTVAARRYLDQVRTDTARERRERAVLERFAG